MFLASSRFSNSRVLVVSSSHHLPTTPHPRKPARNASVCVVSSSTSCIIPQTNTHIQKHTNRTHFLLAFAPSKCPTPTFPAVAHTNTQTLTHTPTIFPSARRPAAVNTTPAPNSMRRRKTSPSARAKRLARRLISLPIIFWFAA